MPKFPTFPTLYDEVLQIHISKLKEWGYLEPGQFRCGTIKWSRNGQPNGSISIRVDMLEESYVELDYKYRDQPRKYRVDLVSITSNLGKGKVWYFLCPQTNKRCRKLYSVGGYFLHREAFKGCMYSCQTQSKYYRQIDKTFGAYFDMDKLYEEVKTKYFKSHYAGKPTKRYLRIMKRIQKSERIDPREIERLMVK